ncbi:MAG: methyl-accepting chemotaxis protein [Rhodocyclaceae bacterium]|nr:methyl-accepting chemotaxis protein [Rhodocyclaceae bacterium]
MNIIQSIRSRLVVKFLAGATAAIALVMAILISIQLGSQERSVTRELAERGRAMTGLLTVSAVQPILNYDFATLERLLATAARDDTVASIVVKDNEGAEIAKARSEAHGTLHPFEATIVGEGDVSLGRLILELDDAPVRAQQAEGLRMALVSLAITLVVLLAAMHLLFSILVGRRLKALSRTMQAMADRGDLSSPLDTSATDEVGRVCAAFNAYTDKMRSAIADINRAVARLGGASGALQAGSAETEQGMKGLSADTDEIASAIDEMSASADSVARSTAGAADAASNADKAGHQAQTVVAHFVASIRSLATEVDQGARAITEVETHAASIDSIVDVIREIADQTNLLALNAAIEAARAGEQGRGFAVVADEVRTLAQRTREATSEIQSTIERLQSTAERAVSVITHGRDQAQRSVGEADDASATLEGIASAVEVIDDMNRQIADAAREQSSAAERVQKLVGSVSNHATIVTGEAGEMRSRAGEIDEISAALRIAVSQFHGA